MNELKTRTLIPWYLNTFSKCCQGSSLLL